MGKGSLFNLGVGGRGGRVCKSSNYEFYIMTLFWLTIYVQTEKRCVSCFINSLFKRKSVTQVGIKLSKISYFIFTFHLTEKKTVVLEKYGLERKDYKETFARGRGIDL